MHLFFYIRGVYHQVELFKILAQGQFWKFRRINLKTKKEEIYLVQGALRPSILGAYEYVFPEESLSEVLAVLGANNPINSLITKSFKLTILRKIFCVEKVPEKNLEEAQKIPPILLINGTERGLSNLKIGGVGIYIIGIKKDARRKQEDWGYEQEML